MTSRSLCSIALCVHRRAAAESAADAVTSRSFFAFALPRRAGAPIEVADQHLPTTSQGTR